MSTGMTRRQLLALSARAAAIAGAGTLLPARAAAQADGAYSPAFEAIDAFAARHLADTHAPGLTLGLATREGGLLRTAAYGFSDVKARVALTDTHLFQIGSISKSVGAVAALRLREDGRLDLDRPIAEYLPWLRIDSGFAPITPHHLLCHTSGLPTNFLSGLDWEMWTSHAPGQHFHYNNRGYGILGHLLAACDGQPFPDVIRHRVLEPLGMRDSHPTIINETRERTAVSYVPRHDDRPYSPGAPLVEAPLIVMESAAGSVLSTPADMAAYMYMILNRGRGPNGRILSDESFDLFTRPVIAAPAFGENGQYAYGIAVTTMDGRTVLRHTGGMVSFSSAMHIDMDEGVAAFASVNARLGGYRPNVVAAYALRALYAARHGEAMPEPPPPDRIDIVSSAGDYAGAYSTPDGRRLAVTAEGDRLFVLRDGRRIATRRSGDDQFLPLDAELGIFPLRFEREGREVVALAHGADWYTNARYAGPRTFDHPGEWNAYAGHYRNDNPWSGSLRIVVRKGRLLLGGDTPLVPVGPATFRVGEDEHSPNRIRFDTIANGRALRAVMSGLEYHRSWAP